MPQVDMSPEAVTRRLMKVSRLRRLCLELRQAFLASQKASDPSGREERERTPPPKEAPEST
jgi:hypothetical protein